MEIISGTRIRAPLQGCEMMNLTILLLIAKQMAEWMKGRASGESLKYKINLAYTPNLSYTLKCYESFAFAQFR